MRNDDDKRILDELLDEMENVRAGRAVRRKLVAGVGGAGLVAIAVVVGVSLFVRTPSPQSPAVIADVPEVVIELVAPPEAASEYAWLERVSTNPSSWSHVEASAHASSIPVVAEIWDSSQPMRFIEIVDDAGLAQAFRETGINAGIARIHDVDGGSRVLLTGSFKTPRATENETEPGTSEM